MQDVSSHSKRQAKLYFEIKHVLGILFLNIYVSSIVSGELQCYFIGLDREKKGNIYFIHWDISAFSKPIKQSIYRWMQQNGINVSETCQSLSKANRNTGVGIGKYCNIRTGWACCSANTPPDKTDQQQLALILRPPPAKHLRVLKYTVHRWVTSWFFVGHCWGQIGLQIHSHYTLQEILQSTAKHFNNIIMCCTKCNIYDYSFNVGAEVTLLGLSRDSIWTWAR